MSGHATNDEAPPGANGRGFLKGQGAKREGPHSQASAPSAQADGHPLPPIRSERHRRVLLALLSGPKTREQLDRAAGASNGPDVVLKLRRRYGLQLPCTLGAVRDRDGATVERGIYRLSQSDRPTVAALVAQGCPP